MTPTLSKREELLPIDLEGRLLERFIPGCLEPDFGAGFLCDYTKPSQNISGPELARYTLDADIKLNGSNYGQRFKKKYFDSTFNFCLIHDEELIATLGFEIDDRALIVWQIQGVKGQGSKLQPIKWSRALLKYCASWAGKVGATEVNVVSVKHNEWTATHGHLDKDRGRLLYDVTAKRCGFKRGKDGYYRLELSSAAPSLNVV
ncbi:MAG: hypothetical protein GY847_04845 [Proteobacteria bacterium]|nr:hypothetical protein [Pseudomonadota bacterium]